MSIRGSLHLAALLCIASCCNVPAWAQAPALSEHDEIVAQRWRDLALTRDSEAAFERLIRMAQAGQLGDDVTNANVGIVKNHVRVELVRAGAPMKVLFLTPKGSTPGMSRYFAVTPGDAATARDAARVGHALDLVFDVDPFQRAYDFFNVAPGGAPLPSLFEAWTFDGWRGVTRGLERRMAALASLTYTVAVIVALSASFLASLWVLWGAPSQCADRGS